MRFNGNTKDLSDNNADGEAGSGTIYTEGPGGEANGAIHLDNTTNGAVSWSVTTDGPLNFKRSHTIIQW